MQISNRFLINIQIVIWMLKIKTIDHSIVYK